MTTLAAAPRHLPLDAGAAAEGQAVQALLNCCVRETDTWSIVDGPGGPTLRVELTRRRLTVVAALRHRSATHQHRYHLPVALERPDGSRSPVGHPLLAALVADELRPDRVAGDAGLGVGGDDAVIRMLDSVDAVAQALAARADAVPRLWGPGPLTFIESEQALLLGHQVHPTPKSRREMGPRDRERYSPELQGSFPLRWFAVVPGLVAHDSATGVPATELARRLLLDDPVVDRAQLDRALVGLGERVLVPAHPWEAEHALADPDLRDLFADGSVVDLGAWGGEVTPTTSVRSVYRADWDWQLKFSLHVRVTNSMRVTLPKELGRAVESGHLWNTELGERARRVAPAFVAIQDPAYLSVVRDGEVLSAFSVLLRQNRWPADASAGDVTALTTLCQDRPGGGPSRLAAIVADLADRTGRQAPDVAREWFARFCSVAVVSLVRLYLDVGLCFEAHQQNTLLELDGGWPARCAYRDSQGYFHRQAAHADVVRVLPGHGEATESIFPEALAAERLVYYLFVNLTLGVVDALGAAGCIEEAVLLADLRAVLESERTRGGRYPATLLDRLLDDPRWPCKGNLRTRLHDMDELVGDIATQSVYVSFPNPILEVRP